MRWVIVAALALGVMAAPVPVIAQAPSPDVQRVLELTNAERTRAGLPPLVLSDQLDVAAQSYSQILATSGCFDHTCGPVPGMADRLGQAGYSGWTAIGENIAAGYRTPEAVVAGWMASPGHRSNILSPKYTDIGIGVVSGTGQFGTYWTQDFGTRAGAPPLPEVDVSPPDQVQAAPAPDDAGDMSVPSDEDPEGG